MADETRDAARVDDLLATQLQEVGRGTMLGLTLADVLSTLDAIGLAPGDVIITGGSQIVCGPTAWVKGATDAAS